jgi:glycosyltransferase involved in cell wall biosynthesis
MREYDQADVIQVMCDFAVQSFLEEGTGPSRLYRLPLGVEIRRFQAGPEVLDARCKRILSGGPLHVLNVGTFGHRKGAFDWEKAIAQLPESRFEFRFVGSIAPDAKDVAARIAKRVEFKAKLPQHDLPQEYVWGDVFALPTLEDGFALVLTQALAAGLPIISTPNCSGPDLIGTSGGGWIIPIRSPEALVEKLCWLDAHREELAAAVRQICKTPGYIDWAESAKLALENISELLKRKEALVLR